MMQIIYPLLLIFTHCLLADSSYLISPAKTRTLYHSLDPSSIAEQLAFYQLYPQSDYGKAALQNGLKLLQCCQQQKTPCIQDIKLPPLDIEGIINLINQSDRKTKQILSEGQLETIEQLSAHLSNRRLKGQTIWTTHELTQLNSDEIDLSRAIFLHELSDPLLIRQYEASLDLMALQIQARLEKNADSITKIKAINRFIFHEMRYRFPPHSLWPKEVDTYTLLPAVMDNRQGVCLGVSILYLSIAQRLNLPLKIYTPPGHIFIAYEDPELGMINIETTARGINLPTETYLGINTKTLPERQLKEVIGMAFMNEAAIHLQRKNYQQAVKLYEKASPYMPEDPLLKTLLGCAYFFLGETTQAKFYLEQIRGLVFPEAIYPETMAEDFLSGRVHAEGLELIFAEVTEKRDSIIAKQQHLQKLIKKCPHFREGLMQLAVTYLQLSRSREALEVLRAYEKIDPHCPTVQYYLSLVAMHRLDLIAAWDHLNKTEQITHTKGHYPKCLKSLRRTLQRQLPENAANL